LLTAACFRGAEREKEAPPGNPGGKCLAPDGACTEGQCNKPANYCYDPFDPCHGFFCGGSDRGMCQVDNNGLPTCVCAPGFNAQQWTHYCCPDPGFGVDPRCTEAPSDSGGSADGGGSSTTGGSGSDGSTGG
jgi:hypothetical protein